MRLLALLLTSSGVAGEPPAPGLYTIAGYKLGDCKVMPAQRVKEFHEWLNSGAWKKGHAALPKVPTAGIFVFRETSTDRCWIVRLLAGTNQLVIDEAWGKGAAMPRENAGPFRCVEHVDFAKLLENEIMGQYAEGTQRILEERKLQGR